MNLKRISHLFLSKINQQPTAQQTSAKRPALDTQVYKDIQNMDGNSKKILQRGFRPIFDKYSIQNHRVFKVQEQWETKSFQIRENVCSQVISLQTFPAFIYALFYLLFQVGFLWFLSSFRFLQFAKNQQIQMILSISLTIFIIDVIIRLSLSSSHLLSWSKKLLIAFKSQLFLMIYSLLNIIALKMAITDSAKQLFYLLDIIAVIIVYRRAKLIWHHIKIMSSTTFYKYQFKLIDLLATLFIFAHLFALLLYQASFYDPTNSWTTHLNDQDLENIERYFYAVYFASTTMFTIGYGDLIPLNKVQITAVLIVQILGAAILSYIINQIGFTLSLIRKQQQQMQKKLSTLSKMAKFYRMEQDVVTVIKENLLNNRKSIDIIYPEDESNVLIKLNEDLREKIVLENSRNVLKSCSFFICHWTKYFQTQIAKKLIKKVLHPNELITQIPGKQKIYIIKSGKLQLYTSTSSKYKQHFKRLLKVIQPKPEVLVSDNVYGYTSVISSKPVKLTAISKDFTSVFTVQKQHFMNCVTANKLDYQYYFEIKDKIDRSRYVESWQAPAALDFREHYKPNTLLIIRHHQIICRRLANNRKMFVRYAKRQKLCQKTKFVFKEDFIISRPLTIGSSHQFPLAQRSSENSETIELKRQQKLMKQQLLMCQFQEVKEYSKYFRYNNLTTILKKFQIGYPSFKMEITGRLKIRKSKDIQLLFIQKQKQQAL